VISNISFSSPGADSAIDRSSSSFGHIQDFGFDLDEQGQRAVKAGVDRAVDRDPAAQRIEVGEPPCLPGGREQRIWALERTNRSAGELLVADPPIRCPDR
jgi:hypothetical protein